MFLRHCHYLQYFYISVVMERDHKGVLSSGTEQGLQKRITDYMEYCRNSSEKGPVFDILSNKIICYACEHKSTVEWLFYRKSYFYRLSELRWVGQSGRLLKINEHLVNSLNDACLRPTRITLATILPFVLLLFLTATVCVVCKRRKALARLQTRENRIAELQVYNDRFAVFLGYNSEDYNFVHDNVDTALNLHLQTIVDTDRCLVCTGDNNFRLGRNKHEDTIRLIQQSYVVVLVVTDSFCTSNFCCKNMLSYVFNEKKPVIVMLNGRVNENTMPTILRDCFNKNTRIVWSEVDGQYILKTTWTNVCNSILETY
ncbi:uncharacterized protein LOC128236647 [Mya arenaria]|uniref:uncharacterized protein LOC128236647 n=1 Tax=Mya arenaria TaxID=6604 RepID=UPI0022E1DE56|nr:uncharacterized protein LOC128236647 [Mya arenaria]